MGEQLEITSEPRSVPEWSQVVVLRPWLPTFVHTWGYVKQRKKKKNRRALSICNDRLSDFGLARG